MTQLLNKNTSRKRTSTAQKGSAGSIIVLVMLLVLLSGMGWAAYNRQQIWDWYKLQGYTAPQNVSSLATTTTMTPYAKRIFYVNQPQITTGISFTGPCPNDGGEQTIVLGCYHGGQNGIFLLSVNDPRLSGVMQVTAAHEMLHAAYARLSGSERAKVDGWLEAYYKNGLTDARIKTTIDAYKKSEPKDVINEMHSIFGTEIASLPPELESYYSRYFVRRATVAEIAATYQSEFTSRRDQIAQDDAQLAVLKPKIDALENELTARLQIIQKQRAVIDDLQRRGDISGYNSAVPGFNVLVDAYNAQLNSLRRMINEYNQLVASRNDIALQEDQLVKELTANAANVSR